MNLETIINTAKNIAHDIKNTGKFLFETAINHPVWTGTATTLVTTAELVRQQATEENIFCYSIATGIAAHAISSVIKNKFYSDNQAKNPILKQPAITALATAGIAAIATFPDNIVDAETKTSMFLASYTLINSLATLANTRKELQKFYDTQKSTTMDKILEQPQIPATIAGIATFAYFAQKFSYGYEHYTIPTFVLNTLLATTAATATLFAGLFTAAIGHSSTRNYYKLALKEKLQKIRGNYDDALATLSEIEKIASQYSQPAIQTEKAELTILKGQYGKGMLMLRDCMQTQTTTTRSPFEVLSDISGITTISSLYTLITAIFQQPLKLIEQGLTDYKRHKTATASLLTGIGVNSDKENLDNKLLSIYFHSTIGDQHEANRELRKIIQQSKQEDFRTIAFSSDEFCTYPVSEIMRTIGLKCSKNDLSYENKMTHIFYVSATNKKQTAQPLAYVRKIKHPRHQDEARDYFCVAYITGIPLSQTEDKEVKLFDALELVLEADVRAQEYCDKKKITTKKTDYFTAFKKFVQRITQDEDEQQRMYMAGIFIPAYLSCEKQQIIDVKPHA